MNVIVDSGSTKADWSFIGQDGSRIDKSSPGFNPVLHSPKQFASEILEHFSGEIAGGEARHIYFYGSGCWDEQLKGRVKDALHSFFPNATYKVYHDLLGAARATCGHQPGISCILGTGSNSCAYDGQKVVDNVTNLGYFLGDEGSGTHLGKRLIRAYFYRELPPDLSEAFDQRYPGGKGNILKHIYGQEVPNRYLASFAKFYAEHREHPTIQNLIIGSFGIFLDRHVIKYEDYLQYPIHFIGSIAHYFKNELQLAINARKLKLGKVIPRPIDDLVSFHTELVA